MEGIIESGGFQFKETGMTGNSLDEIGEFWRVMGLSWETQKNKISMDVKNNYGEKKKGAYLEDSADLSCPEANLQLHLARRVL
jgi:hypothetical protein